MSAPVISWYEEDNSTILSKWDIGIVDAGIKDDAAPTKTMLIWNNRGGTEDVSDMQDTKVTTTDGAADTMDVIAGKWISCRVDSLDELDFTPIGGNENKVIGAKGQNSGIIRGTANSANMTDEANFAKVTLRAKPPLNASAGKRSFKTRVSYYYT